MRLAPLAMALGGFVAIFVSVIVLQAAGYQDAPLYILGVGLFALGIAAGIGTKWR